MRVVAGAFALWMMLVPVTAASAATKPPTITRIKVSARQVWTSTGILLRKGDTLTIGASGLIHFGASPINKLTPAGIPRGQTCDSINKRKGGTTVWPAPQLDCWSLIGRIGNNPPFAIGKSKTIKATAKGLLSLGVNDNYLPDNTGSWSATVIVTAAPPKSSNVKLFVLVGGVVLAALLIVAALIVRRRTARKPVPRNPSRPRDARKPRDPRKPREPKAPGQSKAPKPEDVTAAAVAAAGIAGANLRPGGAPPVDDSEFTEVNIFEVEFSDRASLRVGYNYFPEGTVVNWRVAQRARHAASGEFVTNGGGNTYHFVTIPLGVELEPNPDGADVSFTWAIGSVPFHYSVRREPAR
jgi:hypothetical protein